MLQEILTAIQDPINSLDRFNTKELGIIAALLLFLSGIGTLLLYLAVSFSLRNSLGLVYFLLPGTEFLELVKTFFLGVSLELLLIFGFFLSFWLLGKLFLSVEDNLSIAALTLFGQAPIVVALVVAGILSFITSFSVLFISAGMAISAAFYYVGLFYLSHDQKYSFITLGIATLITSLLLSIAAKLFIGL